MSFGKSHGDLEDLPRARGADLNDIGADLGVVTAPDKTTAERLGHTTFGGRVIARSMSSRELDRREPLVPVAKRKHYAQWPKRTPRSRSVPDESRPAEAEPMSDPFGSFGDL